MTLETFRGEIDSIDSQVIALLAQRMYVSRKVGRHKAREGKPVVDETRFRSMVDERVKLAAEHGLSEEYVRAIWNIIHDASIAEQEELS